MVGMGAVGKKVWNLDTIARSNVKPIGMEVRM